MYRKKFSGGLCFVMGTNKEVVQHVLNYQIAISIPDTIPIRYIAPYSNEDISFISLLRDNRPTISPYTSYTIRKESGEHFSSTLVELLNRLPLNICGEIASYLPIWPGTGGVVPPDIVNKVIYTLSTKIYNTIGPSTNCIVLPYDETEVYSYSLTMLSPCLLSMFKSMWVP